MATALFKGGLSGGAEMGGGSAVGCALPLPLFTQKNLFFPATPVPYLCCFWGDPEPAPHSVGPAHPP